MYMILKKWSEWSVSLLDVYELEVFLILYKICIHVYILDYYQQR